MGATANLSSEMEVLNAGMDSVVIRHYVAGIIGGRTLDVSNYNLPVIKAGHVVIRDPSTDTYKPMPVKSSGDGYDSLPSSHEYVQNQLVNHWLVLCIVAKSMIWRVHTP